MCTLHFSSQISIALGFKSKLSFYIPFMVIFGIVNIGESKIFTKILRGLMAKKSVCVCVEWGRGIT